MALTIVGLGNAGEEYARTRHNAGRSALEHFAQTHSLDAFAERPRANALVTSGKVFGESVTLVLPETMMNASGKAVSAFVKTPGGAKNLIVIHDDLDLPLGTIKMVFGRGSGGHKGVESVMRSIKTEQFARIRIGISGVGKRNQAKKVAGEEKVIKHVIGKWKAGEEAVMKKVYEKVADTLDRYLKEGIETAVQFANTRE